MRSHSHVSIVLYSRSHSLSPTLVLPYCNSLGGSCLYIRRSLTRMKINTGLDSGAERSTGVIWVLRSSFVGIFPLEVRSNDSRREVSDVGSRCCLVHRVTCRFPDHCIHVQRHMINVQTVSSLPNWASHGRHYFIPSRSFFSFCLPPNTWPTQVCARRSPSLPPSPLSQRVLPIRLRIQSARLPPVIWTRSPILAPPLLRPNHPFTSVAGSLSLPS